MWSLVKKKDNPDERRGSIKRRLTGAVLIPSVALIVMWAIVSSYMVYDGFYARQIGLLAINVSIPSVNAMEALQKERQLTMAYLGRPTSGLREVHDQQQQTDKPLRAYRQVADPVVQDAPAAVAVRMAKLHGLLDQLPTIRSRIDSGDADKTSVNDYYNKTLDAATDLFYAYTRVDGLAVNTTQKGSASVDLFHISDTMSRAVSLASSAIAVGSFSTQDHLEFTRLVASYRAQLEATVPVLPQEIQDSYQRIAASDSWKALNNAENTLIERGSWLRVPAGVPSNEADWLALANPVSKDLIDLTITAGITAADLYLAEGTRKLEVAVIGSLLALLAAIASIVVAVRTSRTLVDRALVVRLQQLKNDSIELRRRLPEIVKRVRGGESIEVTTELPELDYGGDEIGQLATAFNETQQTAVVAAVNEARAREGVHNVFLGIAHRNQGLVHRQLQILDAMEREEESPEQLERLFQLDHFATQSRRNAENLMILGGEQPGRRWRKPARLVDVLRAAVSEIEQYSRVQVDHVPAVSVAGSVVADIVHLIAELVDNATAFSPKTSQVHVTSTQVARGIAVEVEDHGLGMSEETLQRANAMMIEPPEFDAMALKADPRLGLFVVARLAARLGAKVEFRISPYGGTRVIVLIFSHVLAPDGQGDSETDGALQLSRRAGHVQNSAGKQDNGVNHQTNGSAFAQQWASRRTRLGSGETAEGGDVELSLDIQPPISPVPGQHSMTVQPRQAHFADGRLDVPSANSTNRPQLPQRRPQQNIAPQLQNEHPLDMTEPGEGRSAEEIRRTMSAFQKGSEEGRQAGESLDF